MNINLKTKNKCEAGKTPTPTPLNQQMKPDRSKQIASIFIQYAEKYTGDILLPRELVSTVTRELKRIKVNVPELIQLDERPYTYLSHDQASQSHWFMRRFRNSDGWRNF